MCRIFYNPNQDINFKEKDLENFFYKLQGVSGGDGDGVYLMKIGLLEKCAWVSPIAWTKIRGEFLFHTRKATHGEITNYNTQPFEGERYVLVHNGIFPEIDPTAVALGCYQTKYSDSWKMHYVIERIGLINFYLAFAEESFGVLVVHDKTTKKTYLLKSTGTFTSACFDGSYIYGSSNLNFWKIDKTINGKPKITNIGNGLYILTPNGAQIIHKLKKVSSYNYYYGAYGAKYDYPDYSYTNNKKAYNEIKKRDAKKEKRKKRKKKKKRVKKDEKTGKLVWLPVKEDNTSTDTNDEEIAGLSSLFGDDTLSKIPKFCKGCTWIKDEVCWYQNYPHEGFEGTIHANVGLKICNSEYKKIYKEYKENNDDKLETSSPFTCDYCEHPFKNGDKRYLDGKRILCITCHQLYGVEEEKEEECYYCHYKFTFRDAIFEDGFGNPVCDGCDDFMGVETKGYKEPRYKKHYMGKNYYDDYTEYYKYRRG